VVRIPQRELRNNVSDVLRRAEAGERFTITVDGRPVAELGPLARPHRLAPAAQLAQILADAPVDSGQAAELERLRGEDEESARDPWGDVSTLVDTSVFGRRGAVVRRSRARGRLGRQRR